MRDRVGHLVVRRSLARLRKAQIRMTGASAYCIVLRDREGSERLKESRERK